MILIDKKTYITMTILNFCYTLSTQIIISIYPYTLWGFFNLGAKRGKRYIKLYFLSFLYYVHTCETLIYKGLSGLLYDNILQKEHSTIDV